jgi:hypothetical protein
VYGYHQHRQQRSELTALLQRMNTPMLGNLVSSDPGERGEERLTLTSSSRRSLSAMITARQTRRWQGLTLVHFSSQPEPCLTHKNTLHTPNTPSARATQPLRAPLIHRHRSS